MSVGILNSDYFATIFIFFFNISPRYQWYSYPRISSALTSNKTSLDTGKTKYAIKAWQYILADYINNPNSDRGVAFCLVNKRDKINECNFGKFVLVLFDHDDFYLCSLSWFKLIKLNIFSWFFLAEEKKKERECCWFVMPLPGRKENQSTKRNFLYWSLGNPFGSKKLNITLKFLKWLIVLSS